MEHWICLGAHRDLVRVCGERVLAYNTRSGETHLLDALAGAALLAVLEQRGTARALARRLAQDLPPGAVADWDLAVERVLRELAEQGLVEARPGCG